MYSRQGWIGRRNVEATIDKKRKKNIFFRDNKFVSDDESQNFCEDLPANENGQRDTECKRDAGQIIDDVDSQIMQLENTYRASSAANTNETTWIAFTNESYERSDYLSFKDDLEAGFLSENLAYPEHFPNYCKDFEGDK